MFLSKLKILLILTLLSFSILILKNREKEDDISINTGELFLMTHCPYADDALRKLVRISTDPDLFNKIKLRYIVYDLQDKDSRFFSMKVVAGQTQGACVGELPDNLDYDHQSYYALHGDVEIEETKRRLLLEKTYPDLIRSYLDAWLVSAGNWRTAIKSVTLDAQEWESLTLSESANDLLKENCKLVEDLKIASSPTLIINGRIVPILQMTDEDLRRELCIAGILNDSCEGIRCINDKTCLPKIGYKTVCQNGLCEYVRIEPEEDAITVFVITPQNCNLCRRIGPEMIMPDYLDRIRFEHIKLEDSVAQEILRNAVIHEFPVVAVKKDVINLDWGDSFVSQHKFKEIDDFFLLQLNDAELPYAIYGQVLRKKGVLSAQIDHSSESLLLHQNGDLENAVTSYLLAVQENSADIRSLNNLGTILYRKGGWSNTAKVIFEKCLKIDSRYVPSLQNLISFYENSIDVTTLNSYKLRLALVKMSEKNYSAAESILNSILSTEKPYMNDEVCKALGYCLIKLERPEEALALLKSYIDTSNDVYSPEIANLLGGIYYRLELYSESEQWYRKALELGASVKYVFNLVQLMKKQQRIDDALDLLEQGVMYWPDDLSLKMEIALIHVSKSNYIEAESILYSLVDDDRFTLRCNYLLAQIHFHKNEHDALKKNAQEFTSRAAAVNGKFLKDELLQIAGYLSNASLYDDAIIAYSIILRWEPSNVIAHKGIAIAYESIGSLDKSEEHLKYMKQFGGAL